MVEMLYQLKVSANIVHDGDERDVLTTAVLLPKFRRIMLSSSSERVVFMP